MMIDFDSETATVRLDQAGLDALLDCAASADLVGNTDASMALASGRLDPAMSAIFNPEAGVTVEIADPVGMRRHQIWVGDVWATYLLDERPMRMFADIRTFLPAGLVRLVDIRPANVAERTPVEMESGQVERLFAHDTGERRAALNTAAADRAWRITSAMGDASRQVIMTDGRSGLRIWTSDEGLFAPITNTLAFRILTMAAPSVAPAADTTANSEPGPTD